MVIIGNNQRDISELKKFLSSQFEMKNLDVFTYFLVLEVSSGSDGYFISQAKYTSDLLSKTRITDSTTATTPLEPNVRLTPLDGSPLQEVTLYCQLVGSLVYLTVTRPDVAYAVHQSWLMQLKNF